MRKLFFILCTIALLTGCKKNDISLPNALYFGDELKLQADAPVQVVSRGSGNLAADPLVVKVVSISDSRCPTGVSCMWAGKAEVTVNLARKEGESANIGLCLGQCSNSGFKDKDISMLTLNGTKYKITLLQVNPYPTTENTREQKTVVLKVEEEL